MASHEPDDEDEGSFYSADEGEEESVQKIRPKNTSASAKSKLKDETEPNFGQNLTIRPKNVGQTGVLVENLGIKSTTRTNSSSSESSSVWPEDRIEKSTVEILEEDFGPPEKVKIQNLGLKLDLDLGLNENLAIEKSQKIAEKPQNLQKIVEKSQKIAENHQKSSKFDQNFEEIPEIAENFGQSESNNDWSVDDWDVDTDSKSLDESLKANLHKFDTEESSDSDENAQMVTPASDKPKIDRLNVAQNPEDSRKISDTSANFEKLDENLCIENENMDVGPSAKNLENIFGEKGGPKFYKSPEKPVSLWGGWNTWISAATDSISVLTNTVGEGFTSVLETMESTLGAPTPEELARLTIDERCQLRKKADEVKEPPPEDEKDDCDSVEEVLSEGGSDSNTARSDRDDLSSGYQSDSALFAQRRNDQQQDHVTHHQRGGPGGGSGLFSNVSHLFETTGRTLVTGSLDVMETIGKKTFDVLTEPVTSSSGAPGGHVTRPGGSSAPQPQRRKLKFQPENPSLSSVLNEIREKTAAQGSTKSNLGDQGQQKLSYDRLFEKYQGSVNLEALEMLSENQRVHLNLLISSISSDKLAILGQELEKIKKIFNVTVSNGDDSPIDTKNFESDFNKFWDLLLIFSYKIDRLLETRRKHLKIIDKIREDQIGETQIEPSKIYECSIQFLAEYTAQIVEMFLKIGQLFVVEKQKPEIEHLSNLTKLLVKDIDFFSSKYSLALKASALNANSNMESLSSFLTNLFLEANNSSVCIRDAAHLLLPIIQVLHVENYFL